jgi:hypothetical protein
MPRWRADALELLGALERELARRREDEHLRLRLGPHALVDERQAERGRLARARACLHHDVGAFRRGPERSELHGASG